MASNAGVVSKNRKILGQYLAIGSMTAGRAIVTVDDRAVYCTDDDVSMNLVYHSLQHGRPR